ncbi:hypothetical protein N7454_002936 [Penicillium verhagenii]|nr:hypothetical protein N7454_002936 [Penicillium verhagenii]
MAYPSQAAQRPPPLRQYNNPVPSSPASAPGGYAPDAMYAQNGGYGPSDSGYSDPGYNDPSHGYPQSAPGPSPTQSQPRAMRPPGPAGPPGSARPPPDMTVGAAILAIDHRSRKVQGLRDPVLRGKARASTVLSQQYPRAETLEIRERETQGIQELEIPEIPETPETPETPEIQEPGTRETQGLETRETRETRETHETDEVLPRME